MGDLIPYHTWYGYVHEQTREVAALNYFVSYHVILDEAHDCPKTTLTFPIYSIQKQLLHNKQKKLETLTDSSLQPGYNLCDYLPAICSNIFIIQVRIILSNCQHSAAPPPDHPGCHG